MILKYPITTEKAVRIMEAENKLMFVVSLKATSEKIKKAFEQEFKVKVVKVNTLRKGKKKIAFIKISDKTPAIDIATRLGLM